MARHREAQTLVPRVLTVPDAERIARKKKRRRRRWERQQRAAAEQPVRFLEGYAAVPHPVAMLAPSFASKTGTDSYDDEEDYILDEDSSSGIGWPCLHCCVLFCIVQCIAVLSLPVPLLCSAVLCPAMRRHALMCCAMLCYAMLCYAMLCFAMLCYALLCFVMPHYDALCLAMLMLLLCVQMIQMMSRKPKSACLAHASPPAWSSRPLHTCTDMAGTALPA